MTNPHNKNRIRQEKIKNPFAGGELFSENSNFFNAGILFFNKRGKRADEIIRVARSLFGKSPRWKKRRNISSVNITGIRVYVIILSGFLDFCNRFFIRENTLFTVQYITSPAGELYNSIKKITAIP